MAEEEDRANLAGEEALTLWRQGKDAWNAWIDQHPKVDIDFSDVDFSKERTEGAPLISFAEFRFGDGHVSFLRTSFGDGNVSFNGASFGDGNVSFNGASFGNGNVSFNGASFGNGDVSFILASFGDGNVSFFGASFGNGDVSFLAASFGKGRFLLTLLESRKASWKFGESSFGGSVFIDLSAGANAVRALNLSGTRFESSLHLTGKFGCVPDLRQSKLSHHVDFSTLAVTLRRKPGPGWRWLAWRAENEQDGPRLRRLKEIAEGARDHEAALRFAALENQANRWIRVGLFASLLDLAFSASSDYGRSIARPTACLLGLLALATGILFWFSLPAAACWNWDDQFDRVYDSVVLAATQAFAFLPPAKEVAAAANARLFDEHIPRWAGMLALIHSLFSFVCLFLIGLGLRNRFRL